ncbi:MAG: DegV family protein [Anaerocolumna sp.]
MRDYVIITESTSDITKELVEELGVIVIPMEFEMNQKSYIHYPDAREMGIHEFYEGLKAGNKSVTSLVNTQIFLNYFEPILKEGKDILYIGFSSGLSGTYNSAVIAREELIEKYPDGNISCIDTKAASAGEGLLVYTAAVKKKEGLTFEEVDTWLRENILHLCHWFTVDDLFHLKRGGRVSALSAGIGTALNIKPVLHVDDEGHLIPMEKVRGRKKSLLALLKHMVETCTNPNEQVIFIGHGDALEEANFLAEQIKEKLQVKDVKIMPIGPVVGSHSGPGTIAIFFYGTNR